MRVLIIEDDSRTARHLMRSLSESGHLMGHAAGGETDLAMALERIYDVLVLDRRMLALDGLTLMRCLRAANASMPALLSTAVCGARDGVEGLQSGCNRYLA
ncbi:MAG TPA: response regulator [Acetobacteraceae bacterium]|jgi:two-component system, OmpR family, response regulator|nr:response regulator [Acetobacteraceae bacterium]